MDDLVFKSAVVANLYKACLHGEISKDEFFRTKDIVGRVLTVDPEIALKLTRNAEGGAPRRNRLASNTYWTLCGFLFIV